MPCLPYLALFGAPIPIAGIAGDQQAATFGQACHRPGMAKNTYGTGCFMLMNTGAAAISSQNNLLATIGWTLDRQLPGTTDYMLEGSVFMAGATVQWLRDALGIIRHSSDVEALAMSVPDNGGVGFVPAFAGLGVPYWDAYARGTVIGMTRGTTKAHIAVGFWSSQEEIAAQWRMERRFEPHMAADERAQRLSAWHRAVERARAWSE